MKLQILNLNKALFIFIYSFKCGNLKSVCRHCGFMTYVAHYIGSIEVFEVQTDACMHCDVSISITLKTKLLEISENDIFVLRSVFKNTWMRVDEALYYLL